MDTPELDVSQHEASDVPADTSDLDSPPSGAPDVPADTPELDIPRSDNPPDHSGSIDFPDPAASGEDQGAQSDVAEATDSVDVVDTIELPQLQLAQQYIDLLRSAALDKSGMQSDDIDELRNPTQTYTLVDPSPLLRSVRHFINNSSASRKHYESMRTIERLHKPDDPILSFDQVRRRVGWLSGVMPVEHDMCVNSCMAFTGPREPLDACARCHASRYCPGTTKAQKRFTTIPIGPVIQSMYSSPGVAGYMHYLERKLADNVERLRLNGGTMLDFYDDTASGQALLDAWNSGDFKMGDVALQFSIDGAQLRADRPSEAWFFIWVFHNLPPSMRYKKSYVIPGAIVPGPNKPWDIDSFMFPSLYHIAALQLEGLTVYDASLGTLVQSRPLVVFGTADSPGSAFMSGMVGHSGRAGCRLYCDMPSRRRTGDSHYYPAMNCPDNYDVDGCSHHDISDEDLEEYREGLPGKYSKNISCLLTARTLADYRTLRLNLGLCKQTIFSGLPCQPLPVPSLFTMDIMHLSVLNDPDLFIKLFTGKLDVYEPDDRATWDWAIFYRNPTLWSAHGDTVNKSIPFIPSCFGRAPRDPSKKINSGYKAWEFQIYVYGLCPTLLRHLLPPPYWRNFCKLVAGIRVLQRPRISKEELLYGHDILQNFAREFEELYYRRMESRIHFVRQSIHLLTHIAPETFRVGPLACYAQWTLETAIGNLGREIRQDRDMFANLAQRAVLRAQTNSLQARFPDIRFVFGDNDVPPLSTRSRTFDGYEGYAFLPSCENYPSPLSGVGERDALMLYWHARGWPNADTWPHAVCRWAKLQLPNGQKVRSVWAERRLTMKIRRASCVEASLVSIRIMDRLNRFAQVSYGNKVRIANVLYYFSVRFGDSRYPLAMIDLFSEPEEDILSDSSGTVYLCNEHSCVAVVSIAAIHSIVSMFPDTQVDPSGDISLTGKFSLMRHPYTEVAKFTSDRTFEDEGGEGDDLEGNEGNDDNH
jgi:Transposase family tnp2